MTATSNPPFRFAVLVGGAAIASAAICSSSGCSGSRDDDALIVYCAHDQVYSAEILRRFEQQTGIRVVPRFDTEATKSLGLTNLLISEKDRPRCDVFWNNQTLGTVELQRQGILHPYQGPGYERIPDRYKDPEGHWTGFAARLRVYIVNTERLPIPPTRADGGTTRDNGRATLPRSRGSAGASPSQSNVSFDELIAQRFAADDLSRIAVARPMYGTTLSHYAVLWDSWGTERLQEWHADIRRRSISEVAGNSTVMNLVAKGTCDLGWTDTDDFFVAKDRGDPVAMTPIRVEGRTIAIPNSVAIIKGTKKLEPAQKLVDFLLSAETELALAESKARQIPLGPVSDEDLPAEVRPLKQWAEEGCDLTGLGRARAECLEWLNSESIR